MGGKVLSLAREISTEHRSIFVSPHFDDVAYSCGGTISKLVSEGQRPLVITVFAGIPTFTFNPLNLVSKAGRPLAFRVHRGMGFSLEYCLNPAKIVKLRRQEDAQALDYLGADVFWLDYLDGIYRGNARRYTHLQQLLGGEIHPEDHKISQQLAAELGKIDEQHPGITWYMPLGVGRHVDHQLVSAAAQGLIERGASVKFYEDFPYVAADGALQARLQELNRPLKPSQVEIALQHRVEAAALYASQIKMSFGNKNAIQKAIQDYACSILPKQGVPLEQFWMPQ
jgi:LmbE family N-acetylglucosaminyl deacetylase